MVVVLTVFFFFANFFLPPLVLIMLSTLVSHGMCRIMKLNLTACVFSYEISLTLVNEFRCEWCFCFTLRCRCV